jgi:ribosomal protein S18 acetylase RimI-like enzyme
MIRIILYIVVIVFMLIDPSHLRPVTTADQPFLDILYRSTRTDLAMLGAGPAIDAVIAMQQKIHDSGQRTHFPQARHLLLQQDGCCVARIVLDRDAHRLHLVDIAVLPSAQRQGIASGLLRWMQQEAASENLPLTLNVRKDNHVARHMYIKLGFIPCDGDTVFDRMRWMARK